MSGIVRADAPAAFYEGTRTLVNIPGIRDPQLLARFEYLATSARLIELHINPVRGNFDADHMGRVHQHLFKDVYAWAGQYRADHPGFFGVVSPKLQVGLALRVYLERGGFEPRDKEQFVERFATLADRLHSAQPFAFGSHRVVTVFGAQLANVSGYHLDHSRVQPQHLAWAKALGQADDLTGWRTILRSMAVPLRAREFTLALNRGDPTGAIRRHPELGEAFKSLQLAREQLGPAVDQSDSLAQRRYQAVRKSLEQRLEKGLMPQEATERQVQRLLWSEKALQR
jgi:fido (protein-threonine AMPylation protein)